MARKHQTTEPEIPAAHQMVVKLLQSLREYTKASKCKCEGQCTMQRPNGPPTVVFYATYPNGDYMTWFNDGTHFQLYSLVNENLQHVFKCAPSDINHLFEKLNQLKPEFGE